MAAPAAHQQHGRLGWATTLQPAIRLARDGFRPSPRLRRSLGIAQRIGVDHSPAFQALYLPGGQPPPADQLVRNPALARSLELLAILDPDLNHLGNRRRNSQPKSGRNVRRTKSVLDTGKK